MPPPPPPSEETRQPARRRRPLVRVAAILLSVAVTCGALDVVVRVLLHAGVIPTPSIWLFEGSREGVRFDPVTGFRLGPGPTRVLRITDGAIEYASEMRGNNLGFPDAEDFRPQRAEATAGATRLAVFGDSFSGNMVVATPWCEVAEDAAAEAGRPVDLLNFSLDGVGLAAWHGVVTHVLEPQDYDLDGVVFAVFPSDLKRRFTIWDHASGDRPRLGRWPNWDVATYPGSVADAGVEDLMSEQSAFIVTSEEFDEAVEGDWGGFRMPAFRHAVRRRLAGRERRGEDEQQAAGRLRTTADLAAALDRMTLRWRVVVHIPSREKLTTGDTSVPTIARRFADAIGAEVWNGCDAFEGLLADEVRELWLPRDGHWAQRGADRFARWFAERTGDLR